MAIGAHSHKRNEQCVLLESLSQCAPLVPNLLLSGGAEEALDEQQEERALVVGSSVAHSELTAYLSGDQTEEALNDKPLHLLQLTQPPSRVHFNYGITKMTLL